MAVKDESKPKRVINRKPKEPVTADSIKIKIRELEKQKRLIDLEIQKLQIEMEFLNDEATNGLLHNTL